MVGHKAKQHVSKKQSRAVGWMEAAIHRIKEIAKQDNNLRSGICVKQARNQEWAEDWATWLKTEFRGHLFHLQPPTFCGFQASESPNETPRPPVAVVTWWSRRAAQPAHSWGQRWVQRGPRGKKNHFFQSCS